MKQKKILAVSSGGGHWIELLRLRPAFENCDIVYSTIDKNYGHEISEKLYVVTDATRKKKLKMIVLFAQMAWIVLQVRPDIVITTGSAPGLAAILFGKLFGAKTIWLESIANADELSTSGRNAKRWADVWLTQWPKLATENGPVYWGSVI